MYGKENSIKKRREKNKMDNKVIAFLVLVGIILICTVALPHVPKNENDSESLGTIEDSNHQADETAEKENIVMEKNEMTIQVNNRILNVELEDNAATKALMKKLEDGYVVVSASEYGGFEKVGMLGFSLPQSDEQMNVKAGDVVLYQGNQISIFYASNSWNYTKLGKITNLTSAELPVVLGDGDVMLTLSKK